MNARVDERDERVVDRDVDGRSVEVEAVVRGASSARRGDPERGQPREERVHRNVEPRRAAENSVEESRRGVFQKRAESAEVLERRGDGRAGRGSCELSKSVVAGVSRDRQREGGIGAGANDVVREKRSVELDVLSAMREARERFEQSVLAWGRVRRDELEHSWAKSAGSFTERTRALDRPATSRRGPVETSREDLHEVGKHGPNRSTSKSRVDGHCIDVAPQEACFGLFRFLGSRGLVLGRRRRDDRKNFEDGARVLATLAKLLHEDEGRGGGGTRRVALVHEGGDELFDRFVHRTLVAIEKIRHEVWDIFRTSVDVCEA